MTTDTPLATSPLTTLSDDEQAFYDSVVEFADKEVRPRVRDMDEHGKIPRDLVDQLFALGVMGIEIPESLEGGGGRFFHAVLAVEALSAVDPSIGVLVDAHNTLVLNALLRWGSEEIKRRYLPQLATSRVGAFALSEASCRQRRVFPQDTGRGGWRRLRPQRPQAVDYERQRG